MEPRGCGRRQPQARTRRIASARPSALTLTLTLALALALTLGVHFEMDAAFALSELLSL